MCIVWIWVFLGVLDWCGCFLGCFNWVCGAFSDVSLCFKCVWRNFGTFSMSLGYFGDIMVCLGVF